MALSQKVFRDPAVIAAEMYGPDSVVVGEFKAAVPAGTTITGNWAATLVGEETGAVADFVEFLRPSTILGRFGAGGVPALRSVMFRVPLITQTTRWRGLLGRRGESQAAHLVHVHADDAGAAEGRQHLRADRGVDPLLIAEGGCDRA